MACNARSASPSPIQPSPGRTLGGTIAVAIHAPEFDRGEPLPYEFGVKARGDISLVTAKITGSILDLARYASKISRKISHLTIKFPNTPNREIIGGKREPSFTEQGNICEIRTGSLWRPPRRTQYSNYYCEKQASFSICRVRLPGRRCLASDRQQDSGRRRRWARSISRQSAPRSRGPSRRRARRRRSRYCAAARLRLSSPIR